MQTNQEASEVTMMMMMTMVMMMMNISSSVASMDCILAIYKLYNGPFTWTVQCMNLVLILPDGKTEA